MDYLASFIVKNKKIMLIFYGALIVISLILMSSVVVNYDLSSYLPGELNSIKGKNILEEEFGITGIAYGLVNDLDFKDIDSIVDKIEDSGLVGGPASISAEIRTITNKGTNGLLKDVSYNTHSIASIIQLAVSMDYSIFLLHRYIEEKKEYANKDEAMIVAIKKTLVSILASSLTTVGGFLALTFMKYEIGRDLGLVLSKGVFFSLLTVITLLPILIPIVNLWIN